MRTFVDTINHEGCGQALSGMGSTAGELGQLQQRVVPVGEIAVILDGMHKPGT